MPIVNVGPSNDVLRIFTKVVQSCKGEAGQDVLSALATATVRGFMQARKQGDDPEVRAWMKAVGEKFIALSACPIRDIDRLGADVSDAK